MWAFFGQFFVNPAFLLGLSAAAIPVILHLRYRRTAVEVIFPSLKLLKLSTRRVARRKKIEELLLLIVRALLLALLALALAKPFLKSSSFLASRTNTALAIVLDNSGSMATRAGGQRRLDLARQRAEEILEGLAGSASTQAGVFLAAGADDQEPGQNLTHKLDDVRTALAKAEPSPRQTSLAGAMSRALDALTQSGEPHRELYLITDLQRYGIREALDQLKDRERSPHLYAAVLPVAPGRPKDLAVVDLGVSGRGLLARTPLTIEATIKNLGEAPVEAQAELFLDGSRSTARAVHVGAGATATVAFPVQFESPGLKVAGVRIADDDNPLNDRRVLALPLDEALRVLLVENSTSALDFQNSSFYVARALDPFGSEQTGVSSGIRPLKVPDQGLLTEDFSKYSAVFLLNPGPMSLEALKRVKTYVRAGGGLVIFPAEATDGARLTQDLGLSVVTAGQSGDGILPAKIGARFGKLISALRPGEEEPPGARVVDIQFVHPVLAPFKGLDRTIFTAVQAQAGLELAVPAGGSAETLLMLDGQRPFLVGGPAGSGEVYLFASAPTPDWTNLPVRSGSVFLPLLHTLCHHLAGRRTQSGSYIVGHQILSPAAPQARKALLVAPDNQDRSIEAKAGEPLQADLDRPGVWRVIKGPNPEDSLAFSVNPDPGEADNERLAAAEVRDELKRVAVESLVADDPASLAAALKRIREGVPLWNFFLVLVLGLAVFEIYLANRVRRGTAAPAAGGAPAAPEAAAARQEAPQPELAPRE